MVRRHNAGNIETAIFASPDVSRREKGWGWTNNDLECEKLEQLLKEGHTFVPLCLPPSSSSCTGNEIMKPSPDTLYTRQ